MATAIRIASPDLKTLEDQPKGLVPSPFPVYLQSRTDPDQEVRRPFNHPSAVIQEHALESSTLEAYRSIAEVQICAIRTFQALLEIQLPPTPRSTLQHIGAHPQVTSTSAGTTVFDYAAELRTIAQHLAVFADEPPMQATSTPSLSVATISRLVSVRRVSTKILDADKPIIDSLITVLTHATTLVQDPYRHLIQHRHSADDFEYHTSLAKLHQSLARLLQSSALDAVNNGAVPGTVQQSLASKHLVDASLSLLNDISQHSRRESTSPASDHRHSHGSELPPEYELGPPAYVDSSVEDLPAAKVRHTQSAPDLGRLLPRSSFASATTEKDQLDLDDVTLAIERLYTVSPQIPGQRVELNPSKRQELELARIMGTVQRLGTRLDSQRAQGRSSPRPASERNLAANSDAKGKGRAEDLESFLDMLSSAQRPRLSNQRAAVSEDLSTRLRRMEAAKVREAANHEAFVDRIQRSMEKGRMQAQDASFSLRSQENTTFLTLPQFIQESGSIASISSDSHLSAITESLALSRQDSNSSNSSGLVMKRKRSFFLRPRSNSAPAPKFIERAETQHRQGMERLPEITRLQYVAEHQENLRIVSVLVTLPGYFSAPHLSVRLARSLNDESATAVDVRIGSQSPMYSIELPVPVSARGPNALDTRLVDDHLELKATVAASWTPPEAETAPLLDAARLNCPNSESQLSFFDLPSEYWSELVEAWMCHSEQKLSPDVAKHGNGGAGGIRPSATNVLVGGSYMLVDVANVVEASLRVPTTAKPWRQIRCVCGAALGAQQAEAGKSSPTYRFAKYAIRPLSSHASYDKVPLSAYVIADMLEIVDAHASHRFIIRDEENEKIRILIWLFNPSVRISYCVSRAFALPKKGTSYAAKVMFKLMGPAETLIVDQLGALFPDFVAADHLFYPLSVCQSLAVLLRNSNIAYPESSRKIGALDLGWLCRV